MPYRYKKNITADNQVFTFASLGATNVFPLSQTLPVFVNPPIINILAVQGDTIVNLHPDNPPTATEFTIIIGSVGQAPSVANPIPFWFEIISQDVATAAAAAANLITAAYVKDRFPIWEDLCTRSDALKTPDEMLVIAIENAEARLQEYTGALTTATITDEITLHLLKIVKYECFQFRHGDTEFENAPQYLNDYRETIKLLKAGKVGTGNTTITSKDRKFDKWFTDPGTTWFNNN